jgi:SAM-dependent methyltransferase
MGQLKLRDNYDGYRGANDREPKITSKGYLLLSRLSKLLKRGVEKYLLESNATILDVGCGKKPYQPFLLGKNILYIGIDLDSNSLTDILCDGEKLPFKESCFSACLCIQVLEHVNELRTVLDEMFRVLKSGGLLFLSTPGNWPVHGAPHDYWRWTEHGLKKLLIDFHIHEFYKCGDPAVSIIQLLALFIPRRKGGVIIIAFLNKLGNLLDKIVWFNARLPDLVTSYMIIASKRI